MATALRREFVRDFAEIGIEDVASVGGKNASLGEMYRELRPCGILVPDGYAVTADAYRHVLSACGAWPLLHEELDRLDPGDLSDFAKRARHAHAIVANAPVPPELRAEILEAYHALQSEYGASLTLAVRSSATAEDLPDASFAGQHESFLNVNGDEQLIAAYRSCLASLFTERAIHYRIDKGFDHFKVGLSVGIMKMVRSDLAAAGVAFTLDTESGFRDVVFIEASYGLAENVVQGKVDPDEFYVFKPAFEAGFRHVLRRRVGSKGIKLVYAGAGASDSRATLNVETPAEERRVACITDDEVLSIAQQSIAVERHYSERAGRQVPMDIEWAKDGVDGRIYLVQARPETVASQKPVSRTQFQEYRFMQALPEPLASGRAVGTRVGTGPARVICSAGELKNVQPGDVLVAQTTSPDWEPVMKTASAIVTDRGGRTCHAAIVARELGIPAVVGAGNATAELAGAGAVTVSCAQGETGYVYAGSLTYEMQSVEIGDVPPPPVKLMLTLGEPGLAFDLRMLPNDGVGLARTEFIIAEQIRAHPMALAHPERIADPDTRAAIAAMCIGSPSPAEYFIRTLSEGVATIAAAFHPKPVIVRMSDFKTNEYAKLIGGAQFEPAESNPMIGFRGASRYSHPAYRDGFALECAAIKRVRDEMGFANVVPMIPFCRRVEEARRVLEQMADFGLRRGERGLEVYVMCEIPNNVVLIDEFSKYFDGFSIGSNDLTQLMLGVDRDSEFVAFDYDERDAGVINMIRLAVEGAKRNERHVGICGQAPSDYPQMAKSLVQMGIDSMSLNPDSLLRTRRALALELAK